MTGTIRRVPNALCVDHLAFLAMQLNVLSAAMEIHLTVRVHRAKPAKLSALGNSNVLMSSRAILDLCLAAQFVWHARITARNVTLMPPVFSCAKCAKRQRLSTLRLRSVDVQVVSCLLRIIPKY